MKKILILTNHFQNSDGVCRSAINLANFLCTLPDVEVTLRPIFKYEKQMEKILDPRVVLKPKYKFYIRGSKRILKLLPGRILYKSYVKGDYDIEIGYCLILPQIAISKSSNEHAVHYAWIHGYEYHEMYKSFDYVVCQCRENADRMKNDIDHQVEVFCCHNLINSERILTNCEQECDLPKSDLLTVISVARMSKEKGFDRLLKAMRLLLNEGYNFRLVLVGDGAELKPLQNLAKELNLENSVIFTGEQTNPHMYVKNSDLYICCSTGEAFNTAMSESYIVGTPAITTQVGGANEMVEDSEVGFVMDNSLDGIKDGLKKVLDNPSLINEWKEKLKETKKRFMKDKREIEIIEALKLNK